MGAMMLQTLVSQAAIVVAESDSDNEAQSEGSADNGVNRSQNGSGTGIELQQGLLPQTG